MTPPSPLQVQKEIDKEGASVVALAWHPTHPLCNHGNDTPDAKLSRHSSRCSILGGRGEGGGYFVLTNGSGLVPFATPLTYYREEKE